MRFNNGVWSSNRVVVKYGVKRAQPPFFMAFAFSASMRPSLLATLPYSFNDAAPLVQSAHRPHSSSTLRTIATYLTPMSRRPSSSVVCCATFKDNFSEKSFKGNVVMNQREKLPPPFGEYFAHVFAKHFPLIASLVRKEQIIIAANVYLFRFDKRLSDDFVDNHIDAVARSIADAAGISVAEARRLFRKSARDASRAYFADGWDNVVRFIHSNAPCLQELQRRNTRHTALLECVLSEKAAPDVDPFHLQTLLETKLPIVVFIYANYCSVCKEIRPIFEEMAADKQGDKCLFVSLNGPKYPDFKTQFDIQSYPTILRFDHTTLMPSRFPDDVRFSMDNISAFADGLTLSPDIPNGVHESKVESPPSPSLLEDIGSSAPTAARWKHLLKKHGIDDLEALASERDQVKHSKINHAIYCNSSGCLAMPRRVSSRQNVAASDVTSLPSDGSDSSDFPPMCILLGGGMGAGKTTVTQLVGTTPFWKAHGGDVVNVEADAFKLSDPLFQVLQGVTPLAASIVHRDSTVSAEELFVKAVNSRRDVLFDGTMSWHEYARQTIDMLRDTEYLYKRGKGYIETDGHIVEEYWARDKKRDEPVEPYCVELVGVTAEADISVMRGIVRRITTGRDVSVPQQLNSHALFSRHFENYIKIVDAAYLFDTTLPSVAEEDKMDYVGQLVALKPGLLFDTPKDVDVANNATPDGFVVRFDEAYRRFLLKKRLNPKASRASELYETQTAER